MTMFGLKEAEVAGLVRPVAGDDLDREEVEERFARAAWACLAEPGDRVAGELLERLGAPRALQALVAREDPDALAARAGLDRDELQQGIDRWLPRLTSATALTALRQAARFGARLLVPGDALWPAALAELGPHAPIALWLRGTAAAVATLDRGIALVGARAATGYGEHVTTEATAGLCDRGYTIVSGAAYGIDGAAHRAALASEGLTVAFLAGGVDRFYPSGHETLLNRVVEHGAVISELPCGSPPTKWRFLQRNRLIATASLATVVLEAGYRSGSLNTASHARQLSRPLGAVPGPVTSSASAGCHRLIREHGAVLVTSAAEMAELAPLPDAAVEPAAGVPEGPDRQIEGERIRVLDSLAQRSARTVAQLATLSGMAPAEVQATLGVLELEGRVREGEHGWVKAG